MPADYINISISPVLHAQLASFAAHAGQTQDEAIAQLLGRAITRAEARAAADIGVLVHPQVGVDAHVATIRIPQALNQRVRTLIGRVPSTSGRTLVKSRVIQALLWHILEPGASADASETPPTPSPRRTITVNVSQDLNLRLLAQALEQGTTREQVITGLLDYGITEQTRDPSTYDALLRAWVREDMRAPYVTIHVPRRFDTALQVLANDYFAGVKQYAVEALLRGMLMHVATTEGEALDQRVLIASPLYRQVAEVVLTQRAQGHQTTIRSYVEQAVEEAVRRDATHNTP